MNCECSHCNCGEYFEDLCGYLGIERCVMCDGKGAVENPKLNEYNRDDIKHHLLCEYCQGEGFTKDHSALARVMREEIDA